MYCLSPLSRLWVPINFLKMELVLEYVICLGRVRCGAFVSMVALDVRSRALNVAAIFLLVDRLPIVLWVVWVGTAETIARSTYYF
ncbi:uncharacterized protein F5147DRAFT_722696 [Suillus discolor]|uniref:Uncharacterized protein n=1 Tax=Suillus discolor TaxID=1912936 RepID=A0A9P7EVR8_9AGAM|nr:uncharacterized protein F5147DRAFT_722696 [Suillus discolor]KAG2091966.1 hypothetical protein F5147DRAFT_722696 [Suillus discolor]